MNPLSRAVSSLVRSKVKISPRPGLWGRPARKGQARKPLFLWLTFPLASFPGLSLFCHTLSSPFCLSLSLISITHSLLNLSLASPGFLSAFLSLTHSLLLCIQSLFLLIIHPRGLPHLTPSASPRPDTPLSFIDFVSQLPDTVSSRECTSVI